MVPFKYVDFYDVPRLLILRYRDQLFLLASYFDEAKDDHDNYYTISILPSWIEQKIADSSWAILEQNIGAQRIGTIPVTEVIFDETKRKTLDPIFLDKYLTRAAGTGNPGS